jgi:ABC-type nitrate/sulfonate/bicarbonate transport system ATPase subunit
MGTATLRLTGVSKVYGAPDDTPVRVLDRLDLAVRAGEVLAIVGPSGCGKSTLLNLLADLDDPPGGVIGRAPRSRGGIVFQDPHLLPWLDVRDNVALGLRYRANRGRADDADVDDILARFGLAAVAHHRPAELSGGQAQRVAIARTIVTQPDLLLLDEPFAALDPASRDAMQRWLLDLRVAFDLTILVVTHDVDEALLLGDRIGVMGVADGRIAALHDVPRDTASLAELRATVLGAYETDVRVGPVTDRRGQLQAVR